MGTGRTGEFRKDAVRIALTSGLARQPVDDRAFGAGDGAFRRGVRVADHSQIRDETIVHEFFLVAAHSALIGSADAVLQHHSTLPRCGQKGAIQANAGRAAALCPSIGRQPALVDPSPIADLGHILAVRANVSPVLKQFAVHRLLQSDADALQLRHPVKHAMHEMVAIETVQHGHVEGCRRRAFLVVTTHVNVAVICPAVGETMDRPRVTMVSENHRPVGGKERVKLLV